ncbi:MAG: NAD(P)H-dependent oxidoreductase [Paracoccaceae bacterium]|jgi:NAD(P)H dehydrogenase (quinone)|nr:NAD(P)H-dependent oxidoreductase [Paracoccaceae bacterium]
MTTTLVVLAHPEGRSFNGSWANATVKACRAAGDRVLVSDLTAMGFDAVERAAHYPSLPPAARFDPLKAQEAAHVPPADIAAEIIRLEQADRVIFHFPIWWFSPPAVLKGWLDRVLQHGRIHTVDERFDRGKFKGKRALICATAGASQAECAHNGKEGDIRMQLWPLAQTLRYLGFDVIEPRVAFGVHGYHEGDDKSALEARLARTLSDQAAVLRDFDTLPLWPFNTDADFDANGQLKPDAPSHSPFIRHTP